METIHINVVKDSDMDTCEHGCAIMAHKKIIYMVSTLLYDNWSSLTMKL